ncbi:pyridoxal-phosphate dependent enzyme [Simiduia aestuariiviva]|uniref:Threonine dehydratase n=1 Tax=Simiduia aestuariiviva TaxID=1510459 RepID=A0A839ULB8_9GAMM|nr:pyridoxal-phosphate dependent enzyme [Simiduia aestuariiviva]MBB3167369.1 threonine dehydratase [Simiduia aestuariiviva]
MNEHSPSAFDIEQAATRIAEHIHQTPVQTSQLINSALGCQLFFKCENLQKVGAFKARGALNAVAQLSSSGAVATHSSGNHGAALAYAARIYGRQAYVVMPSTAPAVKKAAVAAYGATIIECEPTLVAREATLAQLVSETGAHFIPPYDHPHIIAGQGTAALELMAQVTPALDCVLTPVGGGGLLAGTAIAVKGCAPGVQVIGAEPLGACDATDGFRSGQRVTEQTPNTLADGLRTTLGELNFAIMRAHVDNMLTVSEADIVAAMALLWTRLKLVVEPSSAVPLAAVMANPDRFAGKRVGIILSGGNVDLAQLPF